MAISLTVCGTMQLAVGATPQARTSVLRLPNGDFLPGKLADTSEPNAIGWQSPFAIEAFHFPLSSVSAAHFAKPDKAGVDVIPQVKDSIACTLEFIGGDVLTGALVGLSDATVEIEHSHAGRIIVDRTHVQRLSRGGLAGSFHYYGPDGLSDWQSSEGKERAENWTEESGQLITDKPGALVLKNLPIPSRAWIEVDLSWKRDPDFKLVFGGNSSAPSTVPQPILREAIAEGLAVARQMKPAEAPKLELFSIETWDQTLVLVREGKREADIAEAMTLPKGPGGVQLRIYYDHEHGKVALYSADRKLLAKVAVDIDQSATRRRGIQLANGKGDLRLEHLAVRDWDGNLPSEADRDRPYVRRKDGSVLYVDVISYDAATSEFVAKDDSGEPARLKPDEVDYLYFDSNAKPVPATARATLFDGTRISGDLQGVKAGQLDFKREGVEQPLALPAGQLRSLASLAAYKPESPPKGRMGRLESDGCRDHGALVDADGDAASCLAWHPQGSTTSSPLRQGLSGRIVYRDPPKPVKESKAPGANRIRVQAQPARPGLLNLFNVFGAREVQTDVADVATVSYPQSELVWLRGGDRLPCSLRHIDEQEIAFESPMVDAKFLPHDAVKAWERVGGHPVSAIDAKKRERLLTLPRMQRNNPPTHLVESQGGDFLRGRLESMDDKTLRMEVRLEPKEIRRDALARVIWLHEEDADDSKSDGEESKPAEQALPADSVDNDAHSTRVQAIRSDGVRLTFIPDRVVDSKVMGESELLGSCQVAVNDVDQLLFGAAIETAAREQLFHDWRLRDAPDPRFAAEAGEPGKAALADSSLSGRPAPDFTLKLLDGGDFQLSKQQGHVVVLDFWASWCGPCMQSMPQLEQLAAEFSNKDVAFFAVNLQEDRETVAKALERLDVKPNVVLDGDGAAAEKFAVTAIPQTVVIDRQGNVAAVFIGAQADFAETLRKAVESALSKE